MAELVAVRNFARVSPNVFRGAQPFARWEYGWLAQSVGVQTIISLRHEDHDLRYSEWAQLRAVSFPVRDDHAPTLWQLYAFCTFVQNELDNGRAVFFHCAHGHGRTSTFAAAWDIWNGASFIEAVSNEYNRYGYRFRIQAQLAILARFAGGA